MFYCLFVVLVGIVALASVGEKMCIELNLGQLKTTINTVHYKKPIITVVNDSKHEPITRVAYSMEYEVNKQQRAW